MPKISVVMPTYNREKLLPRAIKSVLDQTFDDFELIIVDDGSTDNTKKLVKKFQEQDRRIKYFYQENSGGAARPKNTGIKNSQGEFIAILDSDDEWLPEKLEKQLKLFENSENKELGFVACYAIVIDEGGEEEVYKICEHKDVLKNILAKDYMGSGSAIVYRREVFDEVGLFDENLSIGQDWEMRIRLAQKYDFSFVKEALFKYYIHGDNISSVYAKQRRQKSLDHIYNKYKKYYDDDKVLYSDKLRYDGTRYMIDNEVGKARLSFIKSIKNNFFNFKSYLYFLLSLGGRNFYYRLVRFKSK